MAGTDHIKNIFIKQRKVLRDPKRKPILRAIDHYREVLFIADNDQSHRLNEVSKVFRNAKISFLFSRDEKEDTSAKGSFSYHTNDLNLTGKIKNDKLKQMMQMQFDLILDLSADGIINLFLLKKLNGTFLIGKKGFEKSEIYDLLVSEKVDEETFIETIKEQITLLSQNGNK